MGTMKKKDMKKVKNYGRFYALIKKHPKADKEDLVMQFTDGRTTSLRDMSLAEFNAMCDALDDKQNVKCADHEERRKLRNAVLNRLQRLGFKTVDNWGEINEFCMNSKIAGKRLYDLTPSELKQLIRKLEMIISKGGIKCLEEPRPIMLPIAIPKSKYLS